MNNYIKAIENGRMVAMLPFSDSDVLERNNTVTALRLQLRLSGYQDAKYAVFRWRPGMPEDVGSTMLCSGLLHDWLPNPFAEGDENHPGWTCSRCSMRCTEEDEDEDPLVGRVPIHEEWQEHVSKRVRGR
jgi:hypothetical protein